ncbi:MAG: hypothetical protein HOP30_10165 [Cyclobacteriaceae bacterium]|nr:hypothetical protein [Cyclobacteriaceae bacterium]
MGVRAWFGLTEEKEKGKDVFVLYNQITDRFLTFNPVDDAYAEVENMKELKIWDWQYEDIAWVAWGNTVVGKYPGVVCRKLDKRERKGIVR